MNQLEQNASAVVVPCLHIAMPLAFDVCWAGPSPLGRGFCFGSTDGLIQFADDEGRPLPELLPGIGSVKREAVNGLTVAGKSVVVSTRADVNFLPLPGT